MKNFDEKLKAILEENTESDGQGYGHDIDASLAQIKQLISEVVGEQPVVLVDTRFNPDDGAHIEGAVTTKQLRRVFNLKGTEGSKE